MSAPNSGRQSPPPESQTGAQQQSPPSQGQTGQTYETRPGQAAQEQSENTKSSLSSNPKHPLEDIESAKFSKGS
ncbi:uncharacterized protein BO95DRAFT_359712 [Aspergillus brunneoviolaceus CBS 621.78]|uniref:Uncharacterized protein n=2 Tax=Aspergillus TaxID=5052 RepID=A0A8G1RDA6_9EURO|nr:hypothetical protein BO95DRAFT_359712 [Aspergillus brunneoviolaceus CBS 621.78]XP_040795192.1 uncharacterized protein BO72DRAFT_28175 [Aspergillus fijiensis CBS 313.89]RAH47045.1 hypothetical protein BO95DRAFT_359712 [Aspergillus brunneoviolaceus CBS 621.78]RAK71180.1 hypothetical protein BO72DRAFT_28175 [Aspergillus fijiensis CBS 313.89]